LKVAETMCWLDGFAIARIAPTFFVLASIRVDSLADISTEASQRIASRFIAISRKHRRQRGIKRTIHILDSDLQGWKEIFIEFKLGSKAINGSAWTGTVACVSTEGWRQRMVDRTCWPRHVAFNVSTMSRRMQKTNSCRGPALA
ncbi:unnamed protein product, partial [Cladocopium goreaui]